MVCFFFSRKGSQVILSKGNELWMPENHLASPVRTVSGIGLAAFLLLSSQTVLKNWKQRCLHFFNILLPGGSQQMSGDGCEGDPLLAPLGCTLLPGHATHHSQGKLQLLKSPFSDHFQGWGSHSLSGQPVPVPQHPHHKQLPHLRYCAWAQNHFSSRVQLKDSYIEADFE